MMIRGGYYIYSNNDRYISQAACMQITLVGIKNMLVQAVPFLYARNSILNALLLVFIGAMYLRAFFLIKKTTSKRFLFVMMFVIASFMWTIIVFPQNTGNIMSALPRTLPYCFVTCYLLSELRSFEWIEYYMGRYSIVTMLFSLVSAVFIFRNGHITTSQWSSYSMPLSYVTMVAAMWLLYRYFREEKAIWFFLSLLCIAVIVAYGSRNPLLAIIAFIIISVLKKVSNTQTKHRIRYLIMTLIGCAFLIWWKECLVLFGKLFSMLNISSRTIELLTESTISTSGRDVIHAELITALNEHPFIGFGILGDEIVLNDISQSAHGLYLSIFSNYGYIIGGLILIVLIYWNFSAYKCANTKEKEILLIYMCLVWPRGFTGGDIWSSDVFWWLLGLVLSMISYNYKECIEEIEYDKGITYN